MDSLLSRNCPIRSDTIDGSRRTVRGVLATEAPVEIWDNRSGRVITEILLVNGCEAASSVPLLTDHNRSVPSTIGSVRSVVAKGSELVGTLHVSAGSEAADHAWSLIADRHLTGLSVGYSVKEFVMLRRGETKTVNGRSFTAPQDSELRVTTRWRLRETSLVPVPADEMAGIRSHVSTSPISQGNNPVQNLTLQQIIGHDVSSMRLRDLGKAILQRGNAPIPDSDMDVCRAAFATVEGIDELVGIVNAAILRGFRESDTTDGWTRRVPLPNYLVAQLASPAIAPRLEPVPRGATAPTISYSLDSQGWRLGRFGAQFALDERDYEDGKSIGVMESVLEELGKAARRLVKDLIYSTILANADLSDAVPLFDNSRGNYGVAALADTALDAGIAAVGNQVRGDKDGRPVHVGLEPRFLIVPPDLFGLACRLNKDMGSPLTVRSESRLGATGLVDPRNDSTLTGSATNWLLAAPADAAASIVVGFLDGKAEPRIRHFELTGGGRWGHCFDIQLSVGVGVVDGRPLYFSTGAGA